MTIEHAIAMSARGVGRLVSTRAWVEVMFPIVTLPDDRKLGGAKIRIYRPGEVP